MSEKEELIVNINNSFESIRKVEVIETEILLNLDKRRKARGVGSFILFYLVGTAIGGLIMVMFSHIQALGGLVAFSLFLLPILMPIVTRIMRTKQFDKKIDELNETLVKAKSDPSLSWLPMAYRDSVSFQFIASYIQNMRANNLQEAINLFETEKHQARLEENAKYAKTTKISLF
ncbi:MAG: hypothetical protein IJ385_03515 [Ruminiclostridium sp.]|nr:hypothetical protein [Ruminiclostridium sp.]